MAFDGAFLSCILGEIKKAEGSHIDKIHQPSKEELVILLRKKGLAEKLLITVKGGMARMQFTKNAPENPDIPPAFCALLRKYFSGAYFESAEKVGFERIAVLNFNSTNEMGDRVKLKIVCEFFGSMPNVILINEHGKIIDALRRTDAASERLLLSGARYEYPRAQEKFDITATGLDVLAEKILSKGGMLSDAVLKTVGGISPLIAREIAFLAFGDDTEICENTKKEPLTKALCTVKDNIVSGGVPTLLSANDGKPQEFTFMPIKQYGDYFGTKTFSAYADLLDTFYGERERLSRLSIAGNDIIKLIKNLSARARRRQNARKAELADCKNREYYRVCGELIKANLHLIKPGSSKIRVTNFYDENLAETEIKLDPALSAQANAAKYFKDYKKTYGKEQSLTRLIEQDESEIAYLDSVEESISRATGLTDIAEIREELTAGGYIKERQKTVRKRKTAFNGLSFVSPDGFTVLVGKNNTQNDYLTTVLGKKGDIWLHTKNIHGAHVLIKTEGTPPPESTIIFAAKLAAKNSKAAFSSSVPVDFTDIKYVKKPSGAKAGFVIYTNNKTVYVTPEENI